MAKTAEKIKTPKGMKLEIVNPDAAGIDISSSEHQVCVPSDRSERNNRVFGVYTEDLREISRWLKECNINTVAMESTGIYWLPLYRVLSGDGFEVVLVNARDAKNYSGRKTDKADAEWLMLLHSYGLLRPCYQPDNLTREVRNLVRHRDNLIRSGSREVLHIQKEMEQMNLKLDNVLSDILGKSGQRIIEAILEGERNPERLADLADRRCRKSRAEIAKSLEGTWDEDHLFVMRQSMETYRFYQEKILECETKIASLLDKYEIVDEDMANRIRCGKQRQMRGEVSVDVEMSGYTMWGVNVMTMPGISSNSVLRLMAELGPDFTLKFADSKHFVSWANLVPNNKISGGQLLSSKVPKRKNPVGIIFRQCANSLKSSKEPLGDYFRHVKAKSGHLQAMVATGNKLATIFYTMVSRKEEYDASVYAKHRRVTIERSITRLKSKLERLEQEKSMIL